MSKKKEPHNLLKKRDKIYFHKIIKIFQNKTNNNLIINQIKATHILAVFQPQKMGKMKFLKFLFKKVHPHVDANPGF